MGSHFPRGLHTSAHASHRLLTLRPTICSLFALTTITAHEFVNEDGTTPYREALIPAALLNAYGPPRLFAEAEVDELEAHDPRFQ